VDKAFDVLTSVSDDVPPKPAPNLFELAALRMGLYSSEVLVVEDSPEGVTAAIAAEMSVLHLQ
jgi:HAD superfamily hydrolase (TIGR01509 family)